MIKSEVGPPRGILTKTPLHQNSHLFRFAPGVEFTPFIEHFWIVEWDLPDQESTRNEVLSHPSIHLVFEKNNSRIMGIVRKKFTRILQGRGCVFGIKFKPGAFYPFYRKPVSTLTDKSVSPDNVFKLNLAEFETELFSLSHNDKIQLISAFLRPILPAFDSNLNLIERVMMAIISNPNITKVDDLLSTMRMRKRTLQRLFNQYVGVHPKWVIKRYRLHEAAEQIAETRAISWPQLALKLGYFDQAHFIKDFRDMVGCSPAEYWRKVHQNLD